MSGKMLKKLIHLCDKNENEKVRQQIDTISFVEAAYMSRMSVAANNGNVIAAARLKGTLKQPPRFDALAGVQIAASKEALSAAASCCKLLSTDEEVSAQIAASKEALRNAVRSDSRLFDEITRIARSGADDSWFTVEEI